MLNAQNITQHLQTCLQTTQVHHKSYCTWQLNKHTRFLTLDLPFHRSIKEPFQSNFQTVQGLDGYNLMLWTLCGKGLGLKWIPAKQKQMKTDTKDISAPIIYSSHSRFEFNSAKKLTRNKPNKLVMHII